MPALEPAVLPMCARITYQLTNRIKGGWGTMAKSGSVHFENVNKIPQTD